MVEPPKEKPPPKEKVKAPKPQVTKNLSLPFKLNTQLPSVSADFQLQYADHIGFGPIGDGVDMSLLDEPLTPVARVPPVYPISARRKGVEGWVRVEFEVDEQGQVGRIQVAESEPPGIFDRSVIRCISKWRYRPGTIEGVPVLVRMTKTIRFELEKP